MFQPVLLIKYSHKSGFNLVYILCNSVVEPSVYFSFQVKKELLVKTLTKKREVTATESVDSPYTLQEVQS